MWSYKGDNLGSVPSPAILDDLVIVPGNPSVALRVSEGGNPEVVWKSRKLAAAYASPVVYKGRIYAMTGIGVACLDAATGEEIWRERLGNGFSASPIIADGKLYVAKEGGDTSVVQLGDKPKILANNALKEPLLGHAGHRQWRDLPADGEASVFASRRRNKRCIQHSVKSDVRGLHEIATTPCAVSRSRSLRRASHSPVKPRT